MRILIFTVLWLLVSGFTPTTEPSTKEFQALVDKGLCILKLDTRVHVVSMRQEVIDYYRGRGITIRAFVRPVQGGYIIEINKLGAYEIKMVAAHELIHILQYESGQLVNVVYGRSVLWEEDFYIISDIPHSQRPWELDAYVRAVPLISKL